jgi:hypothetical protein
MSRYIISAGLYARWKLALLGMVLLAACSNFDREAHRKAMPDAYKTAEIVDAQRTLFNCAATPFDISDFPPNQIEGLVGRWEDELVWLATPISDHVRDTGIEHRAVFAGRCWTPAMAKPFGLRDLRTVFYAEGLWFAPGFPSIFATANWTHSIVLEA